MGLSRFRQNCTSTVCNSTLNNWCCLYTNLDSLLAKYDEFSAVVHFHKAHIIAVSETWLQDSHSDLLVNLPGYSIYRHDRSIQRGGGVCIYLMDSVFCQFNVTILPNTLRCVECLFLLITSPSFSLVLGCVYRPSSLTYECDCELFTFLTDLFLKYENLVVAGDFNLPNLLWPLLHNVQSASSSCPLTDFLSNTHATQIVQDFTRFRIGQNPSLLDLIFVSNRNIVTDLEHLPPVGKSDHALLKFNMQTAINIIPKKTSVTKTFLDFDKINSILETIDWKLKLSSNSVEENWLNFRNLLHSLQVECSVTKTYITNPSKPWLNNEIFSLIRSKKSLWQKFKRSQLVVDYELHRQASNTLSKKIKLARESYEQRIIESNNPKSLFKYVRRTLNTESKELRLNRPDNTNTTTDYETANLLAHTFSQFYSNIQHSSSSVVYGKQTEGIIDDIPFEREKICEKLKSIKSHSCPGPDKILPVLLRNCSHLLSFPLYIIMKQSFRLSELPKDWKIAYITPIHKNGNRLNAENYRPISLTSPVVKIMESIIVEHLDNFLNKFAIIPREQFGFRKGRSVESNLLACLNDWSLAADNLKSIDVIYLDFAKAFDKVPLNLLMLKLKAYGVSGLLLAWIQSFLTNRKFCVRVSKQLSDIYNVISGVPQGSVLGPKLFLVYVADIPNDMVSSCAMYADDIKLYNDVANSHNLQNDLNKIFNWSENWGVPLNTKKCVVLHIGKNNPEKNYVLNGVSLSKVLEHNDLGVLIDKKLSWTNHILRQVKKANSRMYILHRSFAKTNISIRAQLFKMYIRPILEFASVVWSPSRLQDLVTYENAQRRFTRWCFSRRRPEYSRRIKSMNLISLSERKLRGDLIYTYKILRLGKDGADYFHLRKNERLRGHRLHISKPQCKTNIRRNFLSIRVINDWNKLSTDIIESENTNIFKNRLDKFYMWQ